MQKHPWAFLNQACGDLPSELEENWYIALPPVEVRAKFMDDLTPEQIKVVILGQDPYPNGSATGRAFAIAHKGNVPKSLYNLMKEAGDIRIDKSLQAWVDQGVLLLNSALTVLPDKPGSLTVPWRKPMAKLINKLASRHPDIVWVLMGNRAQVFKKYLPENTVVVKSCHPADRNSRFLGCGVFKRTNEELKNLGKQPIDWLKGVDK